MSFGSGVFFMLALKETVPVCAVSTACCVVSALVAYMNMEDKTASILFGSMAIASALITLTSIVLFSQGTERRRTS